MAQQQVFLHDPAGYGDGYPIIGANSIVFYNADAVYINTSGFLDIATTTSKILGYAVENITMAATNQTVAKVCPKYVYADVVEMVYPTSGAITQTMVGEYAVFSSATAGSQTISNTTSATVGQFLVIGFDPFASSDTSAVVVKAAYRQDDCYSAT